MKIKIWLVEWSTRHSESGTAVFATEREAQQDYIETAIDFTEDSTAEFPDPFDMQAAVDWVNDDQLWEGNWVSVPYSCELDIPLTAAQAFGELLKGKVVTKPEHRAMLQDMGLDGNALSQPDTLIRSEDPADKYCADFAVDEELFKEMTSFWIKVGDVSLHIVKGTPESQGKGFGVAAYVAGDELGGALGGPMYISN